MRASTSVVTCTEPVAMMRLSVHSLEHCHTTQIEEPLLTCSSLVLQTALEMIRLEEIRKIIEVTAVSVYQSLITNYLLNISFLII